MRRYTETIANALDRCRKTGPSTWQACCPAHAEKTPSFSIKEAANGNVLFHCFGGCSQGEIITALKLRGLWPDKPIIKQKLKRYFSESELLEFWLFLNIYNNSKKRPDLGEPTETDIQRAHKIRKILRSNGFGKSRAIRAVRSSHAK